MSFLIHDPMWRPLGAAGEVLPGCTLTFYESGTTTPAAVYADADLATPLTNPVEADSAGNLPAIYGDSAVVYRRQLHDADDQLLLDVDPIHPHVQFPPGTIMMFKGSEEDRDEAYPPSLWEICDGDNGTPDTRDRSPVGVSNTKPISGDDSEGGTVGDTVESTSAGAHTHGGATGSTTLTENQIPSHRHFAVADVANTSAALSSGNQIGENSDDSVSSGNSEYILRSAGASPDATIGRTSATGGGQGHTHPITSGGAHTHNVTIPAPPYFTVWFLMRKAA